MLVSVALQFRLSALTDRDIATSTPAEIIKNLRVFHREGHEISWSHEFSWLRDRATRVGSPLEKATALLWRKLVCWPAGIETQDVTGVRLRLDVALADLPATATPAPDMPEVILTDRKITPPKPR